MAKFYQMEVQTLADDSTAVGATDTYDTSIDAQIAFNTKSASILTAIKQGTIKACVLKTFGETGNDISGMCAYLNNVEPVEAE